MKKSISALVLSLLNLCLVSCGIDTRNWPTIHFPFDAISVKYIEVHLDSQENLTTDFFKVEKEVEINYIYRNLSKYPYKEKKRRHSILANIGTNLYLTFILLNKIFHLIDLLIMNTP